MIIWIASYPKSGNTYLRSFLSAYYFSKKGKLDFDLLLKIHQFPGIKFSSRKLFSKLDASQSWIINQNQFFDKKKIHLVKTHNCLNKYYGNKFTSKDQTIGAIYIVRDPRNLATSLTHHYSLNYQQGISNMLDEDSSLIEKPIDGDHSNFTFLSSWSNHYRSWKNSTEFETMFIRYEDLENNKYEIFKKLILFVNKISNYEKKIDEKKLLNAIKSTSFANMKNKEINEGFEESVYSKITGKKLNFFNLGFNNRWQKILPTEIKKKLNHIFKENIKELKYDLDS